MSLYARVRSWLRAATHRRELERAMDEELQFHRDRYAEDLERTGLPREEARRRAAAELGSIALRKEECREAVGLRLLDELRADLRYAVRLLRRSPAFAVVAVLSLGLGIGANTAIFTLVDTVLLKSLPVKEPSKLFFIDDSGGKSGGSSGPPYPCFEILRDHNRYFTGMAAFAQTRPMNVTIDGLREHVRGQYASASYFDVLGVPALYGRVFTPADDLSSAAGGPDAPSAVISETLWDHRFNRDPSILGKAIKVGRTWVTIVGVTPRTFRGLQAGSPVDLTVPMAASGSSLSAKHTWWFSVVGRLKDGASIEQARADLDRMFDTYMTDVGEQRNRRYFSGIVLVPAAKGLNDLRRDLATPLLIVMAIVGLVLLIGCANLANLLIARASARRSEIAVRLAIGASRGRLMRQLLTEGALLVLMGAAAGLLFARWGVSTLVEFFAGGQQWILLEPQFDLRVLAFTAAVAVLTGLLFSIAPVLHATRIEAAKPDASGWTSLARPRAGAGQALVVIQVALSLVLLSGAALFVRTLHNLNNVQAGFSRHGVLTMHVSDTLLPRDDPARNAYTEHAELARMWETLLERLDALPGISSAALSTMSPLTRWNRGVGIVVPGFKPPKPGQDTGIALNHVTPGYFETFGIRLLDGRRFSPRDLPTSPRVAMLNATAARFYFGRSSPIGRMISFPGQRIPDPYEVVGIVEDTRYNDLRAEPQRMAYLPVSQSIDRIDTVIVGVRPATDPSGVYRAVSDAANRSVPGAFVTNIVSIDQQIDDSMLRERLIAFLASLFGGLALVLACIGVYGILSYAVQRRTREIGIRLAIGAQRPAMMWLVLREIIVLVAMGLLLGIPVVLLVARYVKSQLFEVASTDPLAIAAAMLVLSAAAVVAAYLPARRASGVDPMIALRYE